MDGFVELTTDQCRELLDTDQIGRLAFVTPSGPRIVPVNYVVEGDELRFRTTPYSELATYAVGEQVAFEIDHLDHERERGWSVVAHGLCARVDPDDDAEGRDPEPWAGGTRPLVLGVAWTELTGRRVGSEHWPHPVVSGRGTSHH